MSTVTNENGRNFWNDMSDNTKGWAVFCMCIAYLGGVVAMSVAAILIVRLFITGS